MKKNLTFCIFLFITSNIFAQTIYLSSTDDKLYRLDLNNCTYEFVVDVQSQVYDISFHPNGNLYGVSGNGNFFEIDTLTGNTNLIHSFEGFQTFNSLTIAADGIVYTIGDFGVLWSYDLQSDVETNHGSILYSAAGDLTFSEGELYVAVIGDQIVHIDIDNPTNSSVVIDENVSGDIFGIVSFAEDCSDVETYAITDGNSDIYQIDFENNSLNFVCQLNIEAGGGASTFEFLASSPIVVQNINETNPGCGLDNGSIQIEASGGTGQIEYSIDSVNFQTSGLFENLPAGNYTIVISDDNDCDITQEINLSSANLPAITGILSSNTTCGDENGSITIQASGGTGQLEYSIDGINFQTGGFFDNLPMGMYSITIIDENNCIGSESAEILSEDSPTISAVTAIDANCDNENGSITIEASGGTGQLEYSIEGTNFQISNVFDNLSMGTYSITIIDENNCSDSANAEILSEDSPAISAVTAIDANCNNENGSITIEADGVELEFSINGIDYQHDSVFPNLASGTYTISVIDENDCISTDEVVIASSPELTINTIESVTALCGESDGGLMVEVNGGTGLIQVALNGGAFQPGFSFENLSSGNYIIQAIDEVGCLVETSIEIIQEDCPIYIPNVFSPNNDGFNDLFKIYPHPGFTGEFKVFKVFDRWGANVFEAQNFNPADIGWDGTHKGEKLGVGVYVYFVEYVSGNGNTELIKGDVTMIK